LKYHIEILLGLAGIVAFAAPILSSIAASDGADKTQPTIVASQAEQTPTPAQAPEPDAARRNIAAAVGRTDKADRKRAATAKIAAH